MIGSPALRSGSDRPAPLAALAAAVTDILVVTWRNLVHIRREPEQLLDVTVQPVLFTLLFVAVFGTGIAIPGGGSYADFAIAGLLMLNLTTSSMGTAVGLATDLEKGMMDRFRILPMWMPGVLIGRSLADVLSSALCTVIVVVTGLFVGWRPGPEATLGGILGGFALALLFAYACSWAAACAGMLARGAESAQVFGFLVLFPLSFVSNALVPTNHMVGWLQTFTDWNPVSAVTAAIRTLQDSPNPSAGLQAWPMQHPVWAALGWSVALLAIFMPVASHLFRRRTTD